VQVLIRLRRLVRVFLLAATLLLLCAIYMFSETLLRVAIAGSFAFYVQAVLWLDRRLTARLERLVLLPDLIDHLATSDERPPAGHPAVQGSGG
jgi:predicted PurR-regulated permease PerM